MNEYLPIAREIVAKYQDITCMDAQKEIGKIVRELSESQYSVWLTAFSQAIREALREQKEKV